MPRLSKVGAAALGAFGWTSGSAVSASYLVVAGGGAGGNDRSGGGGAGGLLTGTASLNPTLSYAVTVGAGGATSATSLGSGNNGSNSVFNALTAIGGGGGAGTTSINGLSGGSGGGGNTPSGTGGAGTSGQGNAGGAGSTGATGYCSGGGGGAGAVGQAASSSTVAGNGGIGVSSSISGTATYYAGGGGGGGNSGTAGTGGAGGGGNGSVSTNGSPGTANLGGGGGGAVGSAALNGGQGGSGIVIISYVGAQQFGGGVVTSSGGNTIHTFTTSGTLSPITPLSASYLVVAGGGSGSGYYGGGGGAGGFKTASGFAIDTNSTYLVTIGAGGATMTAQTGTSANLGNDSVFSSITSTGGGYGGQGGGGGQAPATGGSGGGGGSGTAPARTGAAGISGQGNAGGTSPGTPANYPSGGGGGAGAVGASPANTSSNAGAGGDGSLFNGSYYAGGGGGGAANTGAAAGGAGGGGAGSSAGGSGVAGTANTGGGGGGNGGGASGGAGGSGIVIITYPGSTQQMAGGTVTISGGNVIHTFTSSGYLAPLKYVGNSLRFRSSASAYLNRTPATTSNRKTWTWSGWIKKGTFGSRQAWFSAGPTTGRTDSNTLQFGWFTDNGFQLGLETAYVLQSTQVFRDPAAWYHFVVAFDSTQSTATNRVKVYVNGSEITSWSLDSRSSLITQNGDFGVNLLSNPHYLGTILSGTSHFDGYLTEVNFIDGQALTPSSFGTFNSYGVWQPITYGGSYGTNGFYLPFTNKTSTTTLGYDFSPQGNNWTTNNISLTAGATYDSMTDVPTLTSATAANYCVLNPLVPTLAGASRPTISDGNLSISFGNAGFAVGGNMFFSSGQIYFEVSGTNVGGIYNTISFNGFISDSGSYWGYQIYNGSIASNLGSSAYNGTAYGSGAWPVIGIAVDLSTGKIWWRIDSGWFGSGNPATGANPAFTNVSGNITPYWNGGGGGYSGSHYFNFGQRPFTYTAPSGYVALNTYNL